MSPVLSPVHLWSLSQRLHRSGWTRSARLLKAIIFLAYKSILPPQASVGRGLKLGHFAMGVVVHPNVRIGNNVTIWHNVTISASSWIGSDVLVVIEDDVTIGAGAIIVGRLEESLVIGRGASIGAGSVVTRSVAAGLTVVGNPARPVGNSPLGH